MIKTKAIDLASTNMANFGTDLEKNIKQHAAQGEPAWKDCGKAAGIEIWRVVNFKIVPTPKKSYGEFFDGDSYIILQSIKKADGSFMHEVFFWLGEFTTQDEAGTAAYKTVELDDYLQGHPAQHREVQGSESDKYMSLFKTCGGIRIMKGGAESGFHHIKPHEYQPRLLHIRVEQHSHIRVKEVPKNLSSLNSGDVFVLDCGLELWQFNGKKSQGSEKNKGSVLVHGINEQRDGKAKLHIVDEGDSETSEFFKLLGGTGKDKIADDTSDDAYDKDATKAMLRLSEEGGKFSFTKISEGTLSRKSLDTNDVFVIDTGFEIIVWIGKKASQAEKKLGLQYGVEYIKAHDKDHSTPLSRVLEGGEDQVFNSIFDTK